MHLKRFCEEESRKQEIHGGSMGINNSVEQLKMKIQYQQALLVQKDRDIEEIRRSESQFKVLVEEKNAKIQKLMGENYEVRLSLSEKENAIEATHLLGKSERQRFVNENDSLMRTNTRLQEEFNRRQI